jgi:hypothetical protein
VSFLKRHGVGIWIARLICVQLCPRVGACSDRVWADCRQFERGVFHLNRDSITIAVGLCQVLSGFFGLFGRRPMAEMITSIVNKLVIWIG